MTSRLFLFYESFDSRLSIVRRITALESNFWIFRILNSLREAGMECG